ncbi:hypothetical protein A2U01_0039688, partial [Trifolium medium]|nr:hypothetical protein [Trifolium medium]
CYHRSDVGYVVARSPNLSGRSFKSITTELQLCSSDVVAAPMSA